MARGGASIDPTWIENELTMLEKTLAMYKNYASSAQKKEEKEAWKVRMHHMEERIEEAKKKLEKARAK